MTMKSNSESESTEIRKQVRGAEAGEGVLFIEDKGVASRETKGSIGLHVEGGPPPFNRIF